VITELRVPYVDTRAAALRWSLLPSAAPALGVLVVGEGAVRLELRLLGASHCAVLRAGGGELVETVACPAYGARGSPLPAAWEQTVGRQRYRFASTTERLEPAALTALAERLRAGARGRTDRLGGAFPGSPDALTVLHGGTGAGAWWRTWHLYPGAGEVVRTATAVTW
jgi:hypothetical protein